MMHSAYKLNKQGVFVAVCRLSLVEASRGYSLVAVPGLLIVVASLVAELGLQGAWASVAVVHGLSCPVACGIFPDWELNPCPPALDSQPLDHQGSPRIEY